MLTVITPTGERPFAFGLCQKMIARQTYRGAIRWVVVDDGDAPSEIKIRRKNLEIEVIRPKPLWKPGDNTQGRNLLAALDLVSCDDTIVFWEDDDWYSPKWLSEIERQSKKAELVGESLAIYYNVRTRRVARLGNEEHASLRCSAIRGEALSTFREVLQTPYKYYDMRLWKRHQDKAVFNARLTVGMKGLPGRPGIALGHDGRKGEFDKQGHVLRSLIGEDADWYLPFYEENLMADSGWIVVKPFRYNRRDWRTGEEFIPRKRIDAELHEHAKLIARKTGDIPAPKEKPAARKMKIEEPAKKLSESIVTKAPEPEQPKPAEEPAPASEPEKEEEPEVKEPKSAGRKRTAF